MFEHGRKAADATRGERLDGSSGNAVHPDFFGTIWVERKVVADMQVRIGPNRAGPFGVLITFADGIKLFFKEGVTPATADLPVYLAAPIASVVPAMLAFSVIPFG